MDELFDFKEDRQPLSLFIDQHVKYGYNLTSLTEEVLTEWKTNLLNGAALLIGQLVFLKSTDATNVLGTVPALVTDVRRFNTTSLEYTFTLLLGDLNGELVAVKLTNDQLVDTVDVDSDLVAVKDAVINTKLGQENDISLKSVYGIDHILILDKQNEIFNSHR